MEEIRYNWYMTTTETHASSEATNIAQQVIGRKTPIAVAIAEYV